MKRGIAGSLIFQTFDRPGLYNLIANNVNNESFKIWTRNWNILPNMTSNIAANIAASTDTRTGLIQVLPYYADQIPPFDITISFANEYGQAAVKSIYGVELLNEGSGASMDDMTMEETMTFVAREVGPMIPTNTGFDQPVNIDTSVVNAFGFG